MPLLSPTTHTLLAPSRSTLRNDDHDRAPLAGLTLNMPTEVEPMLDEVVEVLNSVQAAKVGALLARLHEAASNNVEARLVPQPEDEVKLKPVELRYP